MIVKDVYKLAYKQVLVAFGLRSSASKALKGFICLFTFLLSTSVNKHK